MNKKQVKAKIMGLLLALILAGCVTNVKLYEGPQLPQNEIAIVTMDGSLGVVTVDGVRPEGFFRHMILKMLPGKHNITLSYRGHHKKSMFNQSVIFTAEAGKSYHINANAIGWRWSPSIVEITGK